MKNRLTGDVKIAQHRKLNFSFFLSQKENATAAGLQIKEYQPNFEPYLN